ncbi:MAG TPA: hypothetical protein VI603_07655 [Saprospiraceae bacterium]|nr:hypothetical protein [Saprospiraceae bacterium]
MENRRVLMIFLFYLVHGSEPLPSTTQTPGTSNETPSQPDVSGK